MVPDVEIAVPSTRLCEVRGRSPPEVAPTAIEAKLSSACATPTTESPLSGQARHSRVLPPAQETTSKPPRKFSATGRHSPSIPRSVAPPPAASPTALNSASPADTDHRLPVQSTANRPSGTIAEQLDSAAAGKRKTEPSHYKGIPMAFIREPIRDRAADRQIISRKRIQRLERAFGCLQIHHAVHTRDEASPRCCAQGQLMVRRCEFEEDAIGSDSDDDDDIVVLINVKQ